MEYTMGKTKTRIKHSKTDFIFNMIVYGISAIALVVVLYPLYFIIIASFSDPYAVSGGNVWFYPVGFTLDGYKELLRHNNIWTGYWNTILYTLVGTFIGLAVNIPAAYALSRKDLVGKNALMIIFTFTMFFNGGLIPTFLTIKDFNLYDTFGVMVLPFSVSVFNIIVARTFFSSSIPDDLWDAAQIDGCGNLRYFFQMVLPLSKAIIAVIGLWIAVGQWNSYFNALIYLQNSGLHPLQLILRDILVTNNVQSALGTGEAAQIALRLSNLMRYSVIIVSTVPIMLIYPFAQKYFTNGNDDPNDEFPICGTKDLSMDLLNMFGITDVNGTHMMVGDDDSLSYYHVDGSYKEGLKWLNKLYDEGIVDPESFTQDGTMQDGKRKNEKVSLVGFDFAWTPDSLFGQWSSEYEALAPIKGPDGKQYAGGDKNGVSSIVRNEAEITTFCETPEIAARWLDEFYDGEASIQNFWGALDTVISKNCDGTYTLNDPPEGTSADAW